MSHAVSIARDAPQPVGLELHVETPENVVLDYQLAGPAVRLAAYLVDLLVRGVLMAVISVVLLCAGAQVLTGTSVGLWLIVLFLNEWGYFVVCEGFFRGKSIGKHALGLRVVQEGGYPVTFLSAMLRNLLRFPDAMPFLLYGVGFVSMLLTRHFQRLGDLAARTVVITERHVVLPREPVILEKIEPLARDEIGTFSPGDRVLSLIDEFLGRRHVLTHERGHELAAILASRLAERLNYQGDARLVQQYPMAFLARVYVTFLRRDEEDEEFAA